MKFAARLSMFFLPGPAMASSTCNVDTYRPVNGATAEQSGGVVSLTWEGESNEQLLIKQAQHQALPGLHDRLIVV
jgi:hypothetical protein